MAENPDIVVIGGGNAALCAAITAAEEGARVGPVDLVLVERRNVDEPRGVAERVVLPLHVGVVGAYRPRILGVLQAEDLQAVQIT